MCFRVVLTLDWRTALVVRRIEPNERFPGTRRLSKRRWLVDRVEMVVDSLHVALMDYERVVILKEKHGDRCLPISVNPVTANAIAVHLHEQPLPSPPYDFALSLIKALDAALKEVIVDELEKGVFRAKVILTHSNETFEISCNPGDAIAIALRTKSPILVAEDILSRTGIKVDEMTRLTRGRDEEDAGRDR